LSLEAERFFAGDTKFAPATKQIRLDRDAITEAPLLNIRSDRCDFARNFRTGYARELQRYRQFTFFEPEIQVIETTGSNLDHDFVRAWLGTRKLCQSELSRNAVS